MLEVSISNKMQRFVSHTLHLQRRVGILCGCMHELWVCSTLRLVSRRAVLTLQQEQRGEWETIVTEAPS